MKKKIYSDDLKTKALQLVKSGTPLRKVAKDLNVSLGSINNWIKKSKEKKETKSPEISASSAEVVALLAIEAVRLTKELELIKQAIEHFKN